MSKEDFIKKYGHIAQRLLNISNPRRVDGGYDKSVITYFVHPDYVNPDNYYPIGHERNKYNYDPKSFKGIHFDEGFLEDKGINLESPYIPYDDLPDTWKQKFDKEYDNWDKYYNIKKRQQDTNKYFGIPEGDNPTGIANPADFMHKIKFTDSDEDGKPESIEIEKKSDETVSDERLKNISDIDGKEQEDIRQKRINKFKDNWGETDEQRRRKGKQ